ncbi:SMC5-SMC6 complex localization factor protein 2 isoform X4 [Channa argus]|uniref:SMC5-SMC6 complex localization factor protein 2 isoform X4 n=1 Tax=Channa argus TaxID=215402 RepID=UPI003522D028
MRKATENQRNNRTLAEYFSPRSKVKDLARQQHLLPSYSTFHQETPMKPSQVPNLLSHPPPRRVLPLESPELCYSNRLAQSWHHSSNPGAIHPSVFVPSNPTSSGMPDQEHNRTPSRKMLFPVVDLNYSSPKRQRDFEHCDDNAKKLCVQTVNSERTQMPKPTVGTSLSTSQVSSSNHSPVLELSPRTTDSHLCTESAFGQSPCLEMSSTFKTTKSSCTSQSPKTCLKKRPAMGAKQAFINSSHNDIVKLSSTSKPSGEHFKKKCEENDKTLKPNTLSSSEIPQKDTSRSHYIVLESHHSDGTSVLPMKILSKRKSDSSTSKPASRQNSSSSSRCIVKQNKTAHSRRHVVIPNDAEELFTPDPMVYIVSPTRKTAKPNKDGETAKLPSSDRSCPSATATSSSTPVIGSLCHKPQNSKVTGSSLPVDTKVSSSVCNPQILLPTIALVRIKPELSTEHIHPQDGNIPLTSSCWQLKEKSVKPDEKCASLKDDVSSDTLETDKAAIKQTSTSRCSVSPPLKRQVTEVGRKHVNEEDPIDVELDLSFALDLDLTQSSHSSEGEQLLSLQEMMERVTKPSDTPEKGTYSEPSTPRHCSYQSKIQLLPPRTKTGIYSNSLDQMLKDINTNKKAKQIEMQLLTACKEDLLRIAEYEEAEENQDEGISSEQQEFLQRYSLMSSAIREVPPGEVVFNLEKFGQIFNQNSLQLRKCMVHPQGTAQKTLLWSSPAQLRLHVTIGLFQESYDCQSPCPTQVTRFLFKMMSVHSERMVSEAMLKALCDIACTAAYQRVKNGNQQFKVWVPSLADVTLVLMNMGVAFVTLFPFENLQPAFTEGDLLEDEYVKIESPSSDKEQSTFPEHNCNNILKYLSYCMGICPRAYSDDELLLLLTVVARIGLDTRLILQSDVELYPLQFKIVNNIRDWDTMLPKICQALTNLTDDHHNMCLLVQLLPDNACGKQLRRHLSLSMISKLLDGNCTYRPTEKEFQLSKLRPYVPRMQPSTLLRTMLSSSSRNEKDGEDMAALDQQAYYLCYSLLTLANEASNFQFFPAQQKEQLMYLCSELETHVKCDIRESEKRLYRSKVKDLVARIYTKWQMLLQRTRPLNGKLYDYWQPLPTDTLISSQEEQMENSDDAEGTLMEGDPELEEDEREITSGSEENEVVIDGEQKEEEKLEEQRGIQLNDKLETGGGSPVNDLNETEDGLDQVPGELNQDTVELEPQTHTESKAREELIETGNAEHIEKETENTGHTELGTPPQPVGCM